MKITLNKYIMATLGSVSVAHTARMALGAKVDDADYTITRADLDLISAEASTKHHRALRATIEPQPFDGLFGDYTPAMADTDRSKATDEVLAADRLVADLLSTLSLATASDQSDAIYPQ